MKLTSYLSFIVIILFSWRTYAHPHNWIDLKTEFVLDNQGQLIEIKQHWLFDIYYSTVKLADIASEYKSQQEGLRYTAIDMAKNLQDYRYFSELKTSDQLVVLPMPKYSTLDKVVREGQQQLMLTMHFVLDTPIPTNDDTLSWRVFDPTYYIDMKHHTSSQILIHNEQGKKCSTRIHSPKPSQELIEYAINLDRTQKDTQGLGAHFAETVFVQCL